MTYAPLPVFEVLGRRDDLENLFSQTIVILHMVIVRTTLGTII